MVNNEEAMKLLQRLENLRAYSLAWGNWN